MGKTTTEKFLKYIKRGLLHRVKSYLKKERVNIDEVIDRRGRTALHIACFLGEDAIVNILLKYGADPALTDKDGNTAVHLALSYALEVRSRAVYEDMVVPLLRVSHSVMDAENREGKSPTHFLKKLKRILRKDAEERLREERIQEELLEERNRKKEEENEWREKMFFEMGADIPQEESLNLSDEDEEHYDQWADRIRYEFGKKHRKERTHNHTAKNKQKQQEQQKANDETERLQREHEAYIAKMAKKKLEKETGKSKLLYDKRCDEMFDAACEIELSYGNMPWPCEGIPQDMVKLLVLWGEKDDGKKYLKEQQVRWHPDRFLQRCGNRINECDKDRIMEAVKGISQELNSHMETVK